MKLVMKILPQRKKNMKKNITITQKNKKFQKYGNYEKFQKYKKI